MNILANYELAFVWIPVVKKQERNKMHCEMLLNMMQSSLNDSETTFRVRVWQGGRHSDSHFIRLQMQTFQKVKSNLRWSFDSLKEAYLTNISYLLFPPHTKKEENYAACFSFHMAQISSKQEFDDYALMQKR